MAGSFFGFDTSLPADLALRQQDGDVQLEEEEFDALNCETFDAAVEGDWEQDHEKLAQLTELEKGSKPLSDGVGKSNAGGTLDPFLLEDTDGHLEASINQLVLEDELEDPAIMNLSKARPDPLKKFFSRTSPPPPLLEADPVGSPSTRSIWTADRVSSSLDDPSIVSVTPARPSAGRPRIGFSPAPATLPIDIRKKLTVGEIERGILGHSPNFPISTPPRTFASVQNIEQDILMKCHARSVDDVEEELRGGKDLRPGPSVTSIIPSQIFSQLGISQPQQVEMKRLAMLQSELNLQQHLIAMQRRGQLTDLDLNLKNQSQPKVINSARGPSIPSMVTPPRNYNFHAGPRHGASNAPWDYGRPRYHTRHTSAPEPMRSNFGDPYAGLMTAKEKQWMVNIQMMQLQSNNPNIDDYYYTTYVAKKKAKQSGQQEGHTIPIPGRVRTESKSYSPPQMENSLGKLQVASVNAPRRIIDVEVVSAEGKESPQPTYRDTRRHKQLLLEIEKLYTSVMDIEDIMNVPDCVKEIALNRRANAVENLWSQIKVDNLALILTVRKGKMLMLRAAPMLTAEQKKVVVSTLLGNFTSIIRRDQTDNILYSFYYMCIEQIDGCDFQGVLKFLQCLQNQMPLDRSSSPSVASHKSHVLAALGHRLGVSIILKLIERASSLMASAPPDLVSQWTSTFQSVTDMLLGNTEVSPPLVPQSDVRSHLQLLGLDKENIDTIVTKISTVV